MIRMLTTALLLSVLAAAPAYAHGEKWVLWSYYTIEVRGSLGRWFDKWEGRATPPDVNKWTELGEYPSRDVCLAWVERLGKLSNLTLGCYPAGMHMR